LGCSIGNKGYEDSFYYDKNNKTLEVDVVINCCGVNTSVEKSEKNLLYLRKTIWNSLQMFMQAKDHNIQC
jgi:hypothetical protein